MASYEVQLEINGENAYPKTKANYQIYKFPTPIQLSPSVPNISKELTITTTKGNPVFLCVSGDNNPMGDGNTWMNIKFFRNGTLIAHQLCESHGNSWNIPFSLQCLDPVGVGTYIYKCEFSLGALTMNLAENGAMEAPQFFLFEI